MADKFDPYREALIVEERTIWPEGADVAAVDRPRIERLLHDDAASCEQLEYVRVHTGFCRTITATAEDLSRVGAGV